MIKERKKSQMGIEIGQRLKCLRKLQRLTQKEITKKVGLSEKGTDYSNYETGYALPPIEKLIAICDIFHTTPNTLLGYSESGRMNSICDKYDIRLVPVAVKKYDKRRPLMPGNDVLLASTQNIMADYRGRYAAAKENNECNLPKNPAVTDSMMLYTRQRQREAALNEMELQPGEKIDNSHVCILRPQMLLDEETLKKDHVILPWPQFENILFNLQNNIHRIAPSWMEREIFPKLLYIQILLAAYTDKPEYKPLNKILTNILDDAKNQFKTTLQQEYADPITLEIIDQYETANRRSKAGSGKVCRMRQIKKDGDE